jgi:hypothetical protein
MKTRGQATIEFTFAMVIIALMIFGLIKIFRWTGMDYAEHAWDREYFRDGKSKPPLITTEKGEVEEDLPMRTKRMNAFTRNF